MPPTKSIARARPPVASYTPGTSGNPLERALAAMGLSTWRFDVRSLSLTPTSAPLELVLGQTHRSADNASSLWIDVVHPADRAWLVAYRELMLGDPLARQYECSYRVLLPDGRERWAREIVQIERDEEERPALLVGVLANITERREQDERRAEGAERFRAAFENAFTGIAMVALDEGLLEVNRAFADVAGRTIAELLEMRLTDVQHPHDREPSDADLVSGPDSLMRRERRYLRPDGDVRWVIEISSVIYDAEARPRYHVVQALDVTEQRNAESRFKSAEAQLLQAQKMEALGQLAGGVAHDFNNLLTVIKSYSQMVLETVDPADPNHEDLSEVVGASDRAAALTRQLLAFSRKQTQHWQSLRVDAIVAETERMLRRLIGTSAELVVHAAPDVADVEADKGQLEQVIMNLVVNARDAMPHGGRISIDTRNELLAAPSCGTVPSIVPAGHYVVVEVTDTGTGMDASTIARIFEPFFTTKPAGHGTGLGLSTVYGIVQQCGGHLVVSSTVGEGSRFSVYLPRRAEDLAELQGGGEVAVVGGTETVLVIEDDDAVRTLTRHVLVRLGYSVLAARDANDGARVAGAFDDDIHLLLCDIHLPGASGHRAAARIRESRPDAAVLFMSGHTDVTPLENEISPALAELRKLEVFPKPFSVEQLARAVRAALDAARATTSHIPEAVS